MISCSYIQDYIDLVRSGKRRVCKEQLLLCAFVEKVFETESIYVDENQADKYFELQKYFNFNLFEWEKFCFVLHNCTYVSPGVLRFPTLVILVDRGSGKNGYLAFETFALTTPINGIQEYDIDICATSEEQAKTSFMDIHKMLERNEKKMRRFFKWNLTEITNLKTQSVIRYRTSNAKSADGGRPGMVCFDEYHAYENYDLINVFRTGFGKKPMPRETITTTMGDVRDAPLDELLVDMLAILSGDEPDNGMLCFICRLDSLDEVYDEENWYKACPSLQYFPELLREIRKEFKQWLKNKSGNSGFITKRMNIPYGTSTVPVTDWENIKATNRPMIDLAGEPCVFGIDYAMISDFLSVGLLFKKNDLKYWITHTWVCKNSKDLSRIKFPIREAEQDGLLTIVDDVEISPKLPIEWLAEMKKHYTIKGGALDSFRYTLLKEYLEGIGFSADKNGANNIKLVRPSDVVFVQPTIKSDFDNRRVVWGDNKLMRWFTNNTKLVPVKGSKYETNNFTFGKIEPKSRKTDGFFALAAAYTQDKMLNQITITSDIFDLMTVQTY